MKTNNRIQNPPQSLRLSREIDFYWIISRLIIHWKWFLLSILLFLSLAYLRLRYSIPIYRVQTSIMLKDNERGGLNNSEISVFDAMGILKAGDNVDNEVQALRSRDLIESVVKELDLHIRYLVKGRVIDSELYGVDNMAYYDSAPVTVSLDSTFMPSLRGSLFLQLIPEGDTLIRLEGGYWNHAFSAEFTHFPVDIETPVGMITLHKTDNISLHPSFPLEIIISPYLTMASFYQSMLLVEVVGKNTSVVSLTLQETHRRRGEDFLATLTELYNQDVMNDKNKAAANASLFINERLTLLEGDLSDLEKEIETYRHSNRLTDIQSESSLLLSEDNNYGKRLKEAVTNLELLDYLQETLDFEGSIAPIPSSMFNSLSLSDGVLSTDIGKYNQLIMDRKRLSATMESSAPAILRLDERIRLLKDDIRTNLFAIRQMMQSRQKELEDLSLHYDYSLGDIPRREREYMEKIRQQKTKADLYTNLLARREEVALALVVTAPSAKVLESALASSNPVAPNRFAVYVLFLFCGFIVPYIVIGIRRFFNYKIETEAEVRAHSSVPITLNLPISKMKKDIVVRPDSTSVVVERFRLLRTNLQFLLDSKAEKVIQVTSCISGEGKTFISMNLAMIFALKYKTLLVGLDIRRPQLSSRMLLSKNSGGIVSYLQGKESDIDSLIVRDVEGVGLDVLPAGGIPSNPNELLMEPALDELFKELRKRYDYIIVDASPVGSVSDAYLIDRVSDATLFIVRQNYTPKSVLPMLEDVHAEKRLKNINILLNGFSNRSSGYGYSYSEKPEENKDDKSKKGIKLKKTVIKNK
ncbi:MAG: polysaccharide biosynthesis tyrosine autokinase [Dysgonamonadaceae bacterium]|jgi:capsular exopolysaccharide synthesis family protein|nr:polysaccharide biosynthesis tyrosine autokinase [Dysgonamonadaceae bacterium]